MHLILNKKVALVICFIVNIIHLNECSSEADVPIPSSKYEADSTQAQNTKDSAVDSAAAASQWSEASDSVVAGQAKRMRNAVFGGAQHNYRSSYVGNKFNRRAGAAAVRNVADTNTATTAPIVGSTSQNVPLFKAKRKSVDEFGDEVKYNVGPGVNISVDKDKELVSVYLDEDCLKDVFTGRGRNKDLVTKILPLFILPFLIQSAVVPFLVSTLKLLLIKSIVVGKIAIFLLLLSAFKNHVKYGYDAGPGYPDGWAPNRRSTLLNEAHLTGYRVEGKPATWIN